MNLVDLVIIVILVGGTLAGLRQGFIVEVAGILGAIVAFAVAKAGYRPVRHVLASFAPHSPWLTIIAYLIVFLVIWGAILIAARMVRRVVRLFMLGPLDRLGGGFIGFLQSALVLVLLLYIGKRVPNHALASAVKHSILAPRFLQVLPTLHHLFPRIPPH